MKGEASYETEKLHAFAKVLQKLQDNLLSFNKSQHEIKGMILGMRQEIAVMIGNKSSEELEQILT